MGSPVGPGWVAPARPVALPMRVALAGFPSPRPDFWRGGNPSVCVDRCGPRLPAPSPGRNHAGRKRACRDAGVPACRRAGAWDVVTPVVGEGRGPRCAHARVPRDPESPTPEGGGFAHASGRVEPSGKSGAGWRWAPGPHPSTVRVRRERSLPLFPVFAVPASAASPCASRACVARAACRVESPRSPSPRQRSHDRGAAVTRPSSGPGIRFWRRGLVTSLSGAAFGETAVGRLRRVAGRVGARRRRRSFGGGGRVCLGGGSVRAGEKRRPRRVSGNLARERGLADVRGSASATVGPSAEVRLGTLPAPSSSGKGARVSRVGNRHPHRVGCPAVRYPSPRVRASSLLRCRRRGLRAMTLPVPEVRPSRASWVRGASPLTSLEGEDRARRRRLSLPLPPLPPRFRARARPGFVFFPTGSRSPPPPRLARRRPPSASPAKPVGAVVVPRPAGSRSLPTPPGGSGITPSSPALRLAAARVQGGPAAAPRPPSSPRPRPSAWNLGVVSRRGVSRGSACRLAAARRFPTGGLSRFRPPAALLPPRPARPPASRRVVRAPVSLRRCVGVSGESPVGSHGRPSPRGSRLSPLSPPVRPGVCPPRHPRAPLARSLGRSVVSASLDGRPSDDGGSLARSRSYLVDPASSICLSQRLSHACLSTHGRYSETANGSLNQLWFLWSLAPLLLG